MSDWEPLYGDALLAAIDALENPFVGAAAGGWYEGRAMIRDLIVANKRPMCPETRPHTHRMGVASTVRYSRSHPLDNLTDEKDPPVLVKLEAWDAGIVVAPQDAVSLRRLVRSRTNSYSPDFP